MRHIIAILLQNESGALTRVAGMFSSRGYNIESLAVATTDDPTVSRLTLVTSGPEAVILQIANQLKKLIDVVSVEDMTRGEHIRTLVSLNPIMIDGTGMCGGCRVLVNGKSQFACVDGPDFDAHQVDFAVLVQRNAMYREAEKRSMDEYRQALEAKPLETREPEAAQTSVGEAERPCAQEAKP